MTETPHVGNSSREVRDWIRDNWKLVHCAAATGPNLALTAWSAYNTVRKRGYGVWDLINNAIVTGFFYADCVMDNPHVEQYFPESEEECQCVSDGGQLWASVTIDGERDKEAFGGLLEAKEIVETVYDNNGDAICQYTTMDGVNKFAEVKRPSTAGTFAVYWYISPAPGSTCCGEIVPPLEKPETPPGYPIIVEREPGDDAACEMQITLIDSEVDHKGIMWNKYYVYSPDNCYIAPDPFCYWESSIGIYFPNSCADPVPFPVYTPPEWELPGLNPVSYRLHVPCSWDEDLGGFTDWVDYNIEGTNDGILGLARRIDGIAYLLDRATQFPYRECNVKRELEGDWVTIAWISDEPSSDSPLRLRKRTRYRSKSNRDSKQLQQYYKDFTWDAGPVCVRHTGSWWGNPQVWASSVEEGKRVIRHLAGEAGLDPDQVGRWAVSSSRNPRIGQTGKMGVRRLEGMPWVSRRDGSNMLPM